MYFRKKIVCCAKKIPQFPPVFPIITSHVGEAASSRYSIKQPESKEAVWRKSGEAGPIRLEVETQSIPHPVYSNRKAKVNFMLMQE